MYVLPMHPGSLVRLQDARGGSVYLWNEWEEADGSYSDDNYPIGAWPNGTTALVLTTSQDGLKLLGPAGAMGWVREDLVVPLEVPDETW